MPDPDANVYDELYDDYDVPDEYVADMDERYDVYGDEQSEWTVPPEEEEEEAGRNVGGTVAASTVRPLNRSDSSTG